MKERYTFRSGFRIFIAFFFLASASFLLGLEFSRAEAPNGNRDAGIRTKVFGKVTNFNKQFVKLEFNQGSLIVPRESIVGQTQIRPGKFVTASPKVKYLTRKRQRIDFTAPGF